jgi:lipopolysaccharide export system protein LptA
MVLTAPELNYNTETDVGSYMSGGRVVNKETTITSAIGYYFHKNSEAAFYGDVVLKSPENTIYADSMRYNTDKEIAYFITKTTIIDKDSNIIVTNSGYYDTKKEKAFLGNNATIKKGDAKVSAKTIDYDKKTKIAVAEGNVVYQDSSDRTTILSNYIYSNEGKALVKAYKDPLMITVSEDEKDTLYLSADTLFSYKILNTDSTKLNDSIGNNDSIKIVKAWYNMKMIQGKMSAVADSMFYSEADSIFKLYIKPILWMDSTQITGDSIYLYNKNKGIERIDIFNNSFIIRLQDIDVYNQIKGKYIQAYIHDKKINLVNVDGSAESIYFIKDKDAYNGANKSVSGFINVFFKDGDVNRIKLTGSPEAEFTPMKKINLSTFRLNNFQWNGTLQPKSKYDVIRDKNQYEKYVEGLPVNKVDSIKAPEKLQHETTK